jgi:hypothetical protein
MMDTDFYRDEAENGDSYLQKLKSALPESRRPDTYFQQLPGKIMLRVVFEKKESKTKLRLMVSVAASIFICMVFISMKFHPHNTQESTQIMSSVQWEDEYMWYEDEVISEALYVDDNGLIAPSMVQDEYGNLIEMSYELE